MDNFIPIDRSTFRVNPDAGLTSKMVNGLRSFTVVEREGGTVARWKSTGPILERPLGDRISVSGDFVCWEWWSSESASPPPSSTVNRTFISSNSGISITHHQESYLVTWAIPSPAYLFGYQDVDVACPNGHQHKFSELEDSADDGLYQADVCPTCGQAVEGIRYETAESAAAEMGMAK